MDVRMPDGTVVSGVPEGVTQSELLARYTKYSEAQAPRGLESIAPKRPAEAVAPAFDPNKPLLASDYVEALTRRREATPESSISDVAVDAGITFLKGAIGLPESFVGVADIPAKGAIGKMLEDAGYKPREAKQILDTYLSEAQQSANRKVAEAKGFLPTIGAMIENPRTIAAGIGESLPQMIGGAGVARGILTAAPKTGAVVAGGLGEGILGAGSAAEQIRGENKDKLLTTKQAIAALGSGVGTAAFGVAGGRLAQKFGLDDIDTMLAAGSSSGGAKSVLDFAKRAGGSGISEGVFEEMPQSAQEKMWMNYATDKPILEGVPEAMGAGLTTGFAMGALGGGAGSVRGRKSEEEQAREKYERPAPDQGLEELARSKGFLTPTVRTAAVQPTEPTLEPIAQIAQPEPVQDVNAPSQDREAMLKELEDQIDELEPALPNKLDTTVAEIQQPEPVAEIQQPEVVAEKQQPTPVVEPVVETPVEEPKEDQAAAPITPVAATAKTTPPPAAKAETPVTTNLQVAEKDIKGQHDATYDAADFSSEEGWFDRATSKLHTQYADGTPVKHYAGNKTSTGVINLTPITTAEEARAAVDAGKHFVTVGADSTAVKEAAPAQTPATKGKKAEKPERKVAKETPLRRAAYEKNPLLTFLADQGLRHVKGEPGSLKTEFSPDKQIMVSGHGPVFKASGKQLDELLPIAIEQGYLPPDGTEQQLYSLVQKAVSGQKVEPVYSAQGVENTAAKYEERMAQDKDAFEERAGQTDAEWHGMSEQEYVDMMAREIATVSNEEFAELDQAVAELDKTPAGNMSVRAAMEALGFTEQEIQDEERRTTAKADEAVAPKPPKSDEASQAAEAFELEAQTTEELKAKQAEVDRLNKENERLSKAADAKAKADAERDEFVLTGSDRPADVAAAQGQQDIFGAMEEPAPAKVKQEEAPLSLEYTKALDDSREATKEFGKAQEAYRAQRIDDDQFLIARKKYDLAIAEFDQAFKKEQNKPAKKAKPEVADEVVGPAEKPAAPRLTREPVTIEGQFTEVGEEKQRALITDQTKKLTDAQVGSLEKFYGFARDTEEFANAVRQDVVNFITKGAEYVNGKIRAIIRSMANGVMSVAVAFNPQFVSQPYTIAVPQYETRIEQVMQEVPASVQKQMSNDAKRAYATIYPAIKGELQANDKFFIVADKQTANTFVFNPDGTPFMQSKTLFGVGIGDFIKGDNNIVSNRITPAGLFDLGLRDAKRSVDEAATAGEYDFGKVFVLDKSQKGANGFYSTTIMHSVWTKETDAKQRLAALQKPGAEDSRYSFGCINVDKETYGKLVTNNLAQMDGAKIFIVPENGKDVMSFVNGEATYSTDIIRQRAEPVTKKTKVEVQRAAEMAQVDRTVVGKEEEGPMYNSIGPTTFTVSLTEKPRSPSLKRRMDKLNRDRLSGKITDDTFISQTDFALKQTESARQEKPVAGRVRGADFIRQKLLEAKRKGDLSPEAVDLAEWFIRGNEQLVDELGVSIRTSKADGVGGQYSPLSRIIILMKGGGSDQTVVHEILHHLERMMPEKVQQSIRKAWAKQLLSAQKKAKTPAEQLYFKLLMNAHYGDNNFDFVDVPSGEMSKVFMKAMAELDFSKPGSKSSFEMAETLLKMSALPISNYQYFNPSEFWAVNGSEIVQGRFDAVQGGVLARLKNWLKELGQTIKGLFGFDSKSPIIKALDSLSKADGTFVTQDMLGDGEYKSVSGQTNYQNYKGGDLPPAAWENIEDTKMDRLLQYALVDKQIDTKRVIERIKDAVGEISDKFNAYIKEELYHGRTAKATKDFLQKELLPLVKDMKAANVTIDEFDEYLHNRHAPEYNEHINKVNPNKEALKNRGSGISNDEAAAYMKDLTVEQKATFEKLAKQLDSIVKNTQDILIAGGIETKETIDAWRQQFPFYVPLKRDNLDYVNQGMGVGAGYGTKGGTSKRATGSLKNVIDIFENIALQREQAIMKSEKARVGRALYGLAIKYPNSKFWLPINPDAIKNKDKLAEELEDLGLTAADAASIAKEPASATFNKKTGLVEYQVNALLRNSDNVFPIRINGKDRFIIFNGSDPRAARMVQSLKNLDAEQMGLALGTIGEVTRFMASVNTQYNPVFGAWNFVRDVQGAALNLSTTDIAGSEGKVLSGVWPALSSIYSDLRAQRSGKAPKGEWQELFERFQKAGGTTGYKDQFSRGKDKPGIVAQELKKLDRGNVRQAADAVFNWLSDYNDAMENAVRLSAFKVALDKGLSEDKAASLAKNLTVNFNRKGASSPTLQSLYAFFNASVQGTKRLAETLKGPAGKKIIAGGFAIGAAQAIALAMAGYDDDEPPQFLKDKNLIIPVFGGDYLIIPMPMGFNIFPGIGRLTTEYILGQAGMITGAKSLGDKALDVTSLVLDSFNPLGSGSLLQIVSPTAFDPLAAIQSNKDAFGRPISKEDRATSPTPGFQRSREGASWFSKNLAELLNYVSSPEGTKYTKGAISPTADQIDYLIGQYTGGVGRELMKAGEYLKAAVKGETEDLPSYRVPIAGKLYGETTTPAAISTKFYLNVTELAKHENELKQRQKNKDDTREYRAEHPEVRFINRANYIENQITALNKQKKALQEKDAPEAQIKKIDDKKTVLMKGLNDQIRKLQQ